MNIESLKENEAFFVEEPAGEYQRRPPCIDIVLFKNAVLQFFSCANKKTRKEQMNKIWSCCDWYVHHTDKRTGRGVYSETSFSIEYKHELHTAIYLTEVGYDVLFAPKGMFAISDKKFDVFLIKDTIMLKADLKAITSNLPNTVANRIIGGSEQASRVVVHILSDISSKVLINALRTGCYRNKKIIEILLIYKNSFYKLRKGLIINKLIFTIIK